MCQEYNLSDIKIPYSESWQDISQQLSGSLFPELGKHGSLKDSMGMTRCHCGYAGWSEAFMQEASSDGLTEQTLTHTSP